MINNDSSQRGSCLPLIEIMTYNINCTVLKSLLFQRDTDSVYEFLKLFLLTVFCYFTNFRTFIYKSHIFLT